MTHLEIVKELHAELKKEIENLQRLDRKIELMVKAVEAVKVLKEAA